MGRDKRVYTKKQRDPNKHYQKVPGQGRLGLPTRQVLEGIFYVLRTGCQWKSVSREYGCGSSIPRYFQGWQAAGFFKKIWVLSLEKYDELEGIGWEWQNINNVCILKYPIFKIFLHYDNSVHSCLWLVISFWLPTLQFR